MEVQRGSRVGRIFIHPALIEKYVDATWEFAHSILWKKQPFSKEETDLAKSYIRYYYRAIDAEQFLKTVSGHYTGYCERILLARQYVSRKPNRYIPHPCIWLNPLNAKGFAGTLQWYESIQSKRRHARSAHRSVVIPLYPDPFPFSA